MPDQTHSTADGASLALRLLSAPPARSRRRTSEPWHKACYAPSLARSATMYPGHAYRRESMAALPYPDRILYRRFLQLLRPYWPYMAGIILLDLLAAPLALVGPVPLKIAVDTILGAQPLPA